ncbi:pilus assembly protein [Zoogloea sp.]|uniref:pilus assembly protein n=1 Tax=Zoogloea sp. TaxID=49181 RepID=UPI0035AF7346
MSIFSTFVRRSGLSRVLAAAALVFGVTGPAGAATTPLADQPILVSDVPANVLLTMSVEFPTAMSRAFKDGFNGSASVPYLGYFDPYKCYEYTGGSDGYFRPLGKAGTNYTCSGAWSGHFLNWATMQGADIFRWALTGGNRSTDTPRSFTDGGSAQTILERAFAAAQGYFFYQFPDKYILARDIASYTNPSDYGVTGAIGSDTLLFIRNGGLGFQFGLKLGGLDDSCTGCKFLNVRVEVCRDPDGTGTLLEGNCKKYQNAAGTKTFYKPVGLIQQYKDKMYFGAFGYLLLNDNNNYDADGTPNIYKDGGVLRAMVQSVEPEITETGAFVTDPYNMLAEQGVTYSGTINYLNKFGQKSRSYKLWDPVSELYAEAIKYFKNLKPTKSYVSGVNAANRDDFPVFTTWNDPATDAKYPKKGPLSCKKNYIVGIGDTNSNFDFNLSGSPYGYPADADSNMGSLKTAKAWTDEVGALEGMPGLSGRTIYNGSYYIAGLAYYAHSSDLRTDIDGIQTVDTYWMDVMEVGYISKNQYWLATKYGGYKKPTKTTPPGPFDASKDTWVDRTTAGTPIRSRDGDPLPNNYFTADSPDAMVAGLRSAFQSIASGSGSGAGAALSSSQVSATSGGANTFQGSYDAASWSGDIVASKVNKISTDDSLDVTTLWRAAAKVDAQGSAGRKIVTMVPSDSAMKAPTPADLKAKPFLWRNLSDVQKLNLSKTSAAPAGDPADGERILNYLRGDRTYESTTAVSNLYRQRASLLGDIVDSKVVYLGKPSASYAESYNPGYTRFKSDQASRKPLIFVGANDGMLHAFDASEGASGGQEVFAVVPYSVYEGPDLNPEVSGLQALARKNYSHRYYMNATPEIRDVDFARTGARLDSFGPAAEADWRTILVAGQGKGGRSFIAMDVTNITDTLTEEEIAGRVLWEFTHPDMGFSFGRPLIAKTLRWGWVVILTGGYNNIGGTKPGQGVLFILNAKTGELLGSSPVYTGPESGSASSPSGFAQIEGYTPSYQEYILDYVYGGDLHGNLWRFDFSNASDDLPPVTKIASFSTGGSGQPITTAPKIEYSADDLKRYVFVGTGRLLAPEDQGSTQQQTMYAVRDGTKTRAFGNKSYQVPFPSGGFFPVTRSNLVAVSNLIEGAKLDSAKPMGWYYDLTGSNGGVSERIILSLQANDGVVTWVGSIMNDDPCNATGNAIVYAVSYGTGQSVLYKLESGLYKQVEMTDPILGGLADTSLVRVGSSIRVLGTDVKGKSSIYGNTVSEAGEPRVVNWRIIRE